ncbi:MAG: response regulator, partial [Bacteroidales bacterium]|nr:response regulator [Bacteroidales bacterium]
EGNINSMAIKLISRFKGSYETIVSKGISEFRFSIPLEVSTEEERQSKAAERIKELKTESKKKKTLAEANILLVEDNPTNQKIVMITLRSLVKNIDTATTGKEALDKFGKSAYDAILMDIQLPIMDGITAAAKIRELEQSTSIHTPIIAITANAMIGDKEKCLSAGMDDYLSKPFQPSQLINILESFVTR